MAETDSRTKRWQAFWGKGNGQRRAHGRFETNLANPLNDMSRPRLRPVIYSPIYNALVHSRTAAPMELTPHTKKTGSGKSANRQRADGHDKSYHPFPSLYRDFYPKDSGREWRERGNEAADAEHRRAYPNMPMRSCYHQIVGDAPRNIRPGDRNTALMMLNRVVRAIEQGGWTRGEWNRLYKMEKKWRARANGEDARYNVVGNRQGGLDEHEREMVRIELSFMRIRRWQDGAGEG